MLLKNGPRFSEVTYSFALNPIRGLDYKVARNNNNKIWFVSHFYIWDTEYISINRNLLIAAELGEIVGIKLKIFKK